MSGDDAPLECDGDSYFEHDDASGSDSDRGDSDRSPKRLRRAVDVVLGSHTTSQTSGALKDRTQIMGFAGQPF